MISSGSNGYTAEAGYNLVTGLGTPVANLLVSDLIDYQGPGTPYSGPTVGPLQDATLIGQGSSSSSGAGYHERLRCPYDFQRGLGHSPLENVGTKPLSSDQQVTATNVSHPTAVAASSSTALVFGPYGGQSTYQITAGLLAAGGLPTLAVTQSTGGVAQQNGTKNTESRSSGEDDQYDTEDDLLAVADSGQGRTHESVLDELVAGLVASPERDVNRPDRVPLIALPRRSGTEGVTIRPMRRLRSRSASCRTTRGPGTGPSCRRPGLAAGKPVPDRRFLWIRRGLFLAGKSASRRISARWSYLNRNPRG